MAALLPADSSHHEAHEAGPLRPYNEIEDGGRWYFSRKDIEENSPSRNDGIDLKKEAYLRKSYCTFLQDLGMRLKVPQVTIATSIVFCHRFFHRQSHAKNDRRTIATVCMFLAGKVEETPRPLKDVIIVSYEIIHKKDSAAAQRIKQKEVYEQQKELILVGERSLLITLAFDLNMQHPYKPLVDAIKKFKVAQNALAQVAWNFVNDGLRTSLCLQFMPHHIAAGAIFLAAKFLKVKLPSDGDKVWWQEFDVNPRQLEEVSNQMLELYEQNRVAPSQASEAEGSASAGVSNKVPSKLPTATEEHAASPQTAAAPSKPGGSLKPSSSRSGPDHPISDNTTSLKTNQNPENDYDSTELKSLSDQKGDGEVINNHYESGQPHKDESFGEGLDGRNEQPVNVDSVAVGRSPQEAIKKIDKDKVKAALEKRRKSRVDVSQKTDLMNDDDLIERELEEGIELPTEKRHDENFEDYNRSTSSNRKRKSRSPNDEQQQYNRHERSGSSSSGGQKKRHLHENHF
ncbi:cyclin-T1-3-like [Impatiens glandulifera]|uniref:cyclin-T1-3-like n=1 Tax=Impatiens glandulifera TaxID=253017 RepID=UPI001FB1167C|nr:cyclin-T1-3-like [Impatiens glandulifera]